MASFRMRASELLEMIGREAEVRDVLTKEVLESCGGMDFETDISEPSSLEVLNIFLDSVDCSSTFLSLMHPAVSKLNGVSLLPIEAPRGSTFPLSIFGFTFAACKRSGIQILINVWYYFY